MRVPVRPAGQAGGRGHIIWLVGRVDRHQAVLLLVPLTAFTLPRLRVGSRIPSLQLLLKEREMAGAVTML